MKIVKMRNCKIVHEVCNISCGESLKEEKKSSVVIPDCARSIILSTGTNQDTRLRSNQLGSFDSSTISPQKSLSLSQKKYNGNYLFSIRVSTFDQPSTDKKKNRYAKFLSSYKL